ncbi:MAG: DDE-type integrase/transposase/recombinase [Candidatus Moranbacteria bacterium]|nr:DDE-type integrase/transposase/recombinase [Candidatus Moranbacteria bacterium]MDZ7612191.1 DDE-type integrase/transposase/recombinase [Candidatus Moranbacteria bacterium]
MVIHKKTRLTPIQREALADDYYKKHVRVCDLCRKYQVSAPTVYKIIHRAKNNDYSIHKSINKKYRCLQYGIKRLAKIEKRIEEKKKKQAKRYNKKYPGEMFHMDTKRLPLLKGESPKENHQYLFVGIDDFSRELFVAIMPDKTQYSAEKFLEQVLEECPYTIEQIYTDNGLEYRGNEHHAFANLCRENKIEQRFTKAKCPRTNGKAERVIRTIMEMWHDKHVFKNRNHRKVELIRFVNYYNNVKPHKGIKNYTPMEKLLEYFFPKEM